MKKLLIFLSVMALLAVAIYVFRAPLKEMAYDEVTRDMFVVVDNDAFDPGPAIGSNFPGVTATWQGRQVRLLDEFAGDRGTVFVATRSADWCPYCMKQMIQLQEHKAAYDEAGIGIVAMTYDEPVLQQAFIDKWGIEYPVLHDVDTLSFKTLGILNKSYQPGDDAYGIPYPGTIIVNPEGVVVGKLFLEAYSVRVDALSALDYALEALGLAEQD
ncbi:redoxin domain-containing protein [Seongchinamella unica]|uniref:Redoxin domain-containing protein n=1 Tax=Seongchinamella unica TaxID=2547392 RepID=A0A4R5LU76_9GAMM|nr:redoxin domain-containing protein [Seongchinamella unica]TDG14738.1 redoxin domain-containing protein [Seongchinamella unica]